MVREAVRESIRLPAEYEQWRAIYRDQALIPDGNPVHRMVSIAEGMGFVSTLDEAEEFAAVLADVAVYSHGNGVKFAEEVDLAELSRTVTRPADVLSQALEVFTQGGGIKSRRLIIMARNS